MQAVVESLKKNVLGTISGIVFLVCLTVYLLHLDKKADLDSEVEQLDIRISTMLKNIKNTSGIEEDNDFIEEQIVKLDERMFDTQELATNYNYFFNIEAETGVKLGDLIQLDAAEEEDGSRRKKKRTPKPVEDLYVKIRYHLKATGEYANLIDFMRRLEGGSSFYRLEKFRISKSLKDNPELLSMDISLLMLGKKAS